MADAARMARLKQGALVALNLGVVFSGVLVAGQFSPWLWNRRLMMMSGAVNAHRVYERRGHQFEFSNQYLSLLMSEDAFHYVMYAVVFYGQEPMLLSAAIPAIYAFFKMLIGAAKMFPSLDPKVGKFIEGKAGQQQPDGTVATSRSDQAFKMVANFELILFFMMWFRTIFKMNLRAAMAAFMYTQFAMLRYTSLRNPRARLAWSALRQRVESVAASPRCPVAVARGINAGLARLDQVVGAMQAAAQAHHQQRQ
mmetsp:Transcript_117/g.300  ORF Transcript_117/g.300 Transcript_117/m.300 type:complete len:253 (+) Transcript_117:87-845(+)